MVTRVPYVVRRGEDLDEMLDRLARMPRDTRLVIENRYVTLGQFREFVFLARALGLIPGRSLPRRRRAA